MFAHFLPDQNNNKLERPTYLLYSKKQLTSSEKNIKAVDSSNSSVTKLESKSNLHPVDGRNPRK